MMGKIIYRVGKDETLNTLSKKYRVPAYIIAKENNLDEVGIGMRVIIPNPKGIRHIAQPFETIEKICNQYNISIDKLKKNNYDIKEVFLGQVIYIPYN